MREESEEVNSPPALGGVNSKLQLFELCSLLEHLRVFPRRLTSGGIFNNRLLFSLLFSGDSCREDRAVMERTKW